MKKRSYLNVGKWLKLSKQMGWDRWKWWRKVGDMTLETGQEVVDGKYNKAIGSVAYLIFMFLTVLAGILLGLLTLLLTLFILTHLDIKFHAQGEDIELKSLITDSAGSTFEEGSED